MNFSNVNVKKEGIFFLKTFWTNGFIIWTVVISLTGIFSYYYPVCQFRESLWFNQLMWVFFVPLIYQIAFKYILYPKTTKQFKSHSKLKILFVSFVLGIAISSIIIEYVYFAGEVLLIIPEHYEQIQSSNYDIVPWLKALNWGFIILFLSVERYKKYLVMVGYIEERENENLKTEHQLSLIILGFFLALSTFVILQIFVEFPINEYCRIRT